MKKRFAAVFAATAILGVTTAFAANPFSDVTPDTWAYQSVSQLANAGIINGYPDGTFKGQTNITRYEMAQMVAKAMANQDRANAEQQAMINRLADEFSTELNNLGVRVSNLENKVGNVKVTGDARLRYKQTEHQDSKFDYRGRIQFNAAVNDNTTATVRVAASNDFGVKTDVDDDGSLNAVVDRAYVAHNFSKELTAVAGRQDLVVGGGLMYDDAFDGAALAYGNDKVSATVGYGTAMAGLSDGHVKDTPTVTLAQANVKVADNVTVGGFYLRGNKDVKVYTRDVNHVWTEPKTGDATKVVSKKDDKKYSYSSIVTGEKYDAVRTPEGRLAEAKSEYNKAKAAFDGLSNKDGDYAVTAEPVADDVKNATLKTLAVYGFNTDMHFGNVWVGGEWLKGNYAYSNAWVAGVGYGNYDRAVVGSWDVKAQYMHAQDEAPILSNTYSFKYDKGSKGWLTTVDYAVAKNVGFTAYYGFGNKTVNRFAKDNNKELADYYQAELNFKF
ncbi:S-layer homology domain-containing protein [Veillonella montpellierensis]|uniref:S-layer homology domain-containing protein n=1 Tax=Veillonella montpellierensis TaxID=187328 RepID=UPI0023F84FA8|nr:S-layer homology domain-containing protein [Veillonella montpellierensis]